MKTITAVTAQKKNSERCNIFLDGSFYCGLNLKTLFENRIKVGDVIDEEKLNEIQFDSERNTAMDKAMTYLSRSIKTEKQVRQYLKDKGYLEKISDKVISKLKEYNLINDADYSFSYASTYSKYKGKRLIAYELKTKGVSEEDISAALENTEGEDEAAAALAKKYLKNKTADFKTIQKCYKHLLSKGFTYDTAKAAVEKFRTEENEDI